MRRKFDGTRYLMGSGQLIVPKVEVFNGETKKLARQVSPR